MSDLCCWACRSPTGVCLSRRTCAHHLEAERTENANDQARRTHRDPTGDQAVNNIMRKTQPRKG